MPRVAIALALAALLAPAAASASCLSATECVCAAGDGILDVVTTGVDGPRTTARIDALHGLTGSWKDGETIALPRQPGDAPGTRLLVHLAQGDAWRWKPVTPDGFIECELATPLFRVPVADAITLAFDANCQQALYDRGFKEPACNDTPGGCSALPLAAPALLPLLLAWRRRAHRALPRR